MYTLLSRYVFLYHLGPCMLIFTCMCAPLDEQTLSHSLLHHMNEIPGSFHGKFRVQMFKMNEGFATSHKRKLILLD